MAILYGVLTGLGKGAFYSCSSLKKIDFRGTVAQWRAIGMNKDWGWGVGDFTITCINGTLDKDGNKI